MLRAKHYLIRGRVQGVGYRYFALEAAQGQYLALVRAKIRKANEKIMPREWIRDVLRDKVSADFSLVIEHRHFY